MAKVLSIISGTPCSCAILATASMSSTLPRGFEIVSPYRHLVFGVIALRKFSGSSGSTNLTSRPNLRKLTSNCVYVPPYRVLADTISSPASSRLLTAMNCAACPEDIASAATPFSSDATRSSRTAVVGFMMRV